MFILNTALIFWVNLGLIISQTFPEGYYLKLIRMKCSPNADFLTNVMCQTRAKGRYETSLTVIFDVVKPIEEFNVKLDYLNYQKILISIYRWDSKC
jgi:hypothetical protein